MNITRVKRDGVEFFAIGQTGESGVSDRGLCRTVVVTIDF
jgi:hypothetical protein